MNPDEKLKNYINFYTDGHLRTVMQRFEYKDSGMKEMFDRWINCSKNNK